MSKYDDALHQYNQCAARHDHAGAIQFARIVRECENASANVSRDHWNGIIAQHSNHLRTDESAPHPGGRKPLPAAQRKVHKSVMLKPETLAYLQAVALPNEALGQTIDRLLAQLTQANESR